MTINTGTGGDYIGSVHIVGDSATVNSLMDEVQAIVYQRLHVLAVENAVPPNSRPGPCGGCGDN